MGIVPSEPRRPPLGLRPLGGLGPLGPGLLLVVLIVAAAFVLQAVVPSASPLVWGLVIGLAVGPVAGRRPELAAGVAFAGRHLLRVGVALLGLRISLDSLGALGVAGVAVAAATFALTMVATVGLGRLLGVDRDMTLLIAAGSSICGASAVAAMNAVSRADEEDVGYAIGTVTVFGTVAMLGVPLAGGLLGLPEGQTGLWAGASIHEVGQVAGAGAALSVAALKLATLMKLTRVVMLAPTVAVVSFLRGGETTGRKLQVPGFVVAFLLLIGARAALPLPATFLDAAELASTALLAAGLTGLGLKIRLGALRAAGARPLVLGLLSWLVAAGVALPLLVLFDLGA